MADPPPRRLSIIQSLNKSLTFRPPPPPSHPDPSIPPATGRSPLLQLPHELQLLIIEHLPFADIARFRRTCRLYGSLITRQLVWSIFAPNLRETLLSHCSLCLRNDPNRNALVCPERLDPRYPFASRCVDCVSRRDEFAAGKKVALGNFSAAWVCRWCGYPVPSELAPAETGEFHHECYEHYNTSTFIFCVLGIFQAMFALIAPILCWVYYRSHVPLILALVTTAFLLGIPCFVVVSWRGRSTRTYHLSAIFEAAVLGMWSGALSEIIRQQYIIEGYLLRAGVFRAIVGMVVINILFRLLNTIGTTILAFEPAIWRRRRAGLSWYHRARYTAALAFIVWAYPQSLKQEYPGRSLYSGDCCGWGLVFG